VLRDSNAIPAPLVIDDRSRDPVQLFASGPNEIAFTFHDATGGIAAADVRVRRIDCPARSISLTLRDKTIAFQERLPAARGIDRIRLDLPVPTSPSAEPYVLRIAGCKLGALAPLPRLRAEGSIFIRRYREPGTPVDALTLYRGS
jgi:hypothetical protein